MPDKNCTTLCSNMDVQKSVILPIKYRVCVDGVPILDAVLNTFFCRGYLLKSAFVSIVHITFKYCAKRSNLQNTLSFGLSLSAQKSYSFSFQNQKGLPESRLSKNYKTSTSDTSI